ncbi:MAG: hypothetical protein KAW88_06085 [Candidatus Cloacimonetes bacterium]|nr:hypothetical protein [Candidatus Cloacimonadota bacterium]
MINKKKLFPLLIVLMLIITSCTVKYMPVESQDVKVTDGFAVVKTKAWTFAIENKYWIKEPQNLTDFFTTFYVSITNRHKKEMEIGPSDISLLDEEGNQFDVVLLDYIEQMLLPKQLDYLIITNLEEDLIETQEIFEDHRRILDEWREAKKNLITHSFHFGKILPGAKKSGFIFFPKLASKNNSCQIIFHNNKINFIRGDVKKKEEEKE